MILGDNPKRCVIYFIYDKDGIIDDYVIDQLKDLRNNAQHIHCVINGKLSHDGKIALEQVADDIYVRENKGVDIGAYKAAIEYLTWNFIRTFDELVVMNNTCFGPVYPFKECFDWAKTQDVDLWGLTCCGNVNHLGTVDFLHYTKNRYHIQSNFVVYRNSLLKNNILENFFNEIPNDCNYIQSNLYYEQAQPGYFLEKGFNASVYCDTTDDLNYSLLFNPLRLLKEYRIPLIKKRSFFHHYTDVLYNTAGEATLNLIDYIKTNTSYNLSFVWKSLLRTNNLSDLVNNAQLRRILPSNFHTSEKKSDMKICLFFHCYYADLFDESIGVMKRFPKSTEIIVTTSSAEKFSILNQKLNKNKICAKCILVENRGRDVSPLLVEFSKLTNNFDLVCFTHDKKCPDGPTASVGRSWARKIEDSLYPSTEFILNVVDMFENEPELGMAFPSHPNHGAYIKHSATGWTMNYDNTVALLNQFGINLNMNKHKMCIAPLGTCFWFRPQVFNRLFRGINNKGWSYSDFPEEPTGKDDGTILHALERSYAYFGQAEGYYPVYLYSDKSVRYELTNLEFQLYYADGVRAWDGALAMNAIGFRNLQQEFNKSLNDISDDELLGKMVLNNDIQQLSNSLNKKNEEVESLNRQLNGLYNSKSWKITKPLRKIMKLLRREK